MKILKIVLAVALLQTVAANAAPAKSVKRTLDYASQPIEAPHENRIVQYTYSPEIIFRVFTVPKHHTHIQLDADEGLIEKPMIGDSIQWKAAGSPNNIYIKPTRPGIETSLTLVTNKRTYQFQLISGQDPETSTVYQKVSFNYPDEEAGVKLRQKMAISAESAERQRLSDQIITRNVDPSSLNFAYNIEGDAPFTPVAVYNDGKFTYLIMPKTQDVPAVFLVDDEGNPSLINYKVLDNGKIRVERVAKGLLLKLNESEVKISLKSKGWIH